MSRRRRMVSDRIGIDEYLDAIVLLNMLVVILDEFPIELLVLHKQLLHFQHFSKRRTVLPLFLLALLPSGELVDEGLVVVRGNDGEGVLLDGEDLLLGMHFAWGGG